MVAVLEAVRRGNADEEQNRRAGSRGQGSAVPRERLSDSALQ